MTDEDASGQQKGGENVKGNLDSRGKTMQYGKVIIANEWRMNTVCMIWKYSSKTLASISHNYVDMFVCFYCRIVITGIHIFSKQ